MGKKAAAGLFLLLLWLGAGRYAQARLLYVDAEAAGGGTGSSWQDAFNYLQDALLAAQAGDEIRVAAGVYRPDRDSLHPEGTGEREASFQLKNGVILRGGYAGAGARDPNARDLQRYESILSGDLADNDEPNFANRDDNCYHVVNGSGTDETAVLDGFVITGGYAYGGDVHGDGGGMVNTFAACTVVNCVFRDNSAWRYGGGMFNFMFCNPLIINCTFTGNRAEYGGGMENRYYGDAILINCLFAGNSAGFGGGMGNAGANPLVINCTFADNRAERRGGGLYNRFDSRCEVANSIFWNNTAPEGPQITLWYNGRLEVSHCDIQGGEPMIQVVESPLDWGYGNIESDPRFERAGRWDVNGLWAEGDYHLLDGSGCIDAGSNAALWADEYDLDGDGDTGEAVPVDLDGYARRRDGDGDGNEVVDIGAFEFWPPVVAEMKFTPQALNPFSGGRTVKAHIILPEGFAVEDVDVEKGVLMREPVQLEASDVRVFVNDANLVEVKAVFERSAFRRVIRGEVEVTVDGWLTSGRRFYGTDTIRIVNSVLERLGGLASYWLESDCNELDRCGGFDIDGDGIVNFRDVALLAVCGEQSH